jgi:hypothetical protein
MPDGGVQESGRKNTYDRHVQRPNSGEGAQEARPRLVEQIRSVQLARELLVVVGRANSAMDH